jgi:hypothetical protein
VVGVSAENTERYKDPDALRDAYERHDGLLQAVYAEFDASDRHVRRLLVQYDIHEPNKDQSGDKYTQALENADPEDLGLSPFTEDIDGGER